ncbi:MAG: Membrane protein [Planctomycetota bacterium]|nr:Membrane protein [Planctomycetota bacterium]
MKDAENPDLGPIHADAPVLIENYKIIADWIRFADAKAGVILGVQGVLASLLIPIGTTYAEGVKRVDPSARLWSGVVLLAYAAWFVLFLVSTLLALRCVVPHRRKGKHLANDRCNHFHPSAIAGCYGESDIETFLRKYHDIGAEGLKREIIQAILIDSHISNQKYWYVYWSSHLFSAELVFAFLFYVLSRF